MISAVKSTIRNMLDAAGPSLDDPTLIFTAANSDEISLDLLKRDVKDAEQQFSALLAKTAQAAVELEDCKKAFAAAVNAETLGVRAEVEEHPAIAELRQIKEERRQ